jgi:hypothetical protein
LEVGVSASGITVAVDVRDNVGLLSRGGVLAGRGDESVPWLVSIWDSWLVVSGDAASCLLPSLRSAAVWWWRRASPYGHGGQGGKRLRVCGPNECSRGG